jgi:hypothetical protein
LGDNPLSHNRLNRRWRPLTPQLLEIFGCLITGLHQEPVVAACIVFAHFDKSVYRRPALNHPKAAAADKLPELDQLSDAYSRLGDGIGQN